MPQTFDVEGVGTLEFPDDAKIEEIQSFLNEKYFRPETSALGAGLREFALGLPPSLAAGAGSRLGTLAGGGWGSLALGFTGAMAAGTAAEEIEQAVLPESIKRLQQADYEQHPWASRIGGFLSGAAGFQVAPLKGFASLPKFLSGKATQEEARTAMGLAGATGLGAATGVAGPLISKALHPDQPLNITAEGILTGVAQPFFYGASRFEGGPTARPARPAATREERAQHYQRAEQKVTAGGRKLNKLEGDIPGFPNDVFHAREDGSVDVSLPKLDQYLEQYIDPSMSKEEAIDRAASEELTHAAQFDMPEARDEAGKYWNDYTAVEKMAMRKIIMGERPKDPAAAKAWDARSKSDSYLGLESSRYWMQRLSKIGPSEMSALQAQGPFTVRMMDRLLAFVRRLREIFGTQASQRQKEYWDRVEANAEKAKKGAQDASQVTGPAGVPQLEVRPRVGEEARVRQPGETAEAQTAVEKQEEVLLTAQELHQKQNEVIEGLRPGEYVVSSAVNQGPMKPVAYGPHHPGILKDIGGEELAKRFEARESRENDMFGFRTNQREWVPRSQLTVRKTGKPAHSDDIPLFGEKTVADQPKSTTGTIPEMEARLAKMQSEWEMGQAKFSELTDQERAAHHQLGRQITELNFAIIALKKKAPPPATTVPPKPGPRTEKNPLTTELFKARGLVQSLEKAVAKDPNLQPELDKARAQLAEVQKRFDEAQKKGAPTAQPGEPPPTAPATVTAKPGVAAPGEPAISETTPTVEKAQGPAEQAWRAHDEEMRVKLHAGGELGREDRLRNRELWKAALAENPDLGVEGAGLTMKYRDREGNEKEVQLPPGEWPVTVQRPDGSTYEASFAGKYYDLAGLPTAAKKYGTSKVPAVAKSAPNGVLSHGMLNPGEKIIAGESGPGAGVTMKGRAVPPYTENEALELSKGIFPDMPPKALLPMVKAITEMKPEDQDAFVNHLRQQAEEMKLKEAHDALMKQRSQQATTQERIEAGTQRRVPLPPQVVARLKLSLHNYFKDTVRPILQTGQLRPEKTGTTYGGKTKITLPTAESPEPVKVRYALPDPLDWLHNIVREPPAGLGIEPDPYVVQASDRQLLDLYDETWMKYLNNAPAEDLVKLRAAHRLDRLDLRGEIPEPELDPLFRILQNIRHGEEILPEIESPAEEKLMAMARTQGIDPTQKGWEDELLKVLTQRVAERLPDIALARGVDITQPGWREKLFKKMQTEERAVGKARAKYIEPAKGSIAQIFKLGREFNDARNAGQRKRARLERMLAQRGSSDMFIARKNPARTRITADDIEIKEGHSDVGPYSQFILIKDIDSDALDYLGHGTKIGEKVEQVYTPDDLKDMNRALVEGNGGIGADATKRVTLLYNTKTKDLDAVSTYWNDTTKKAMIYDPTGEPGRRDRDHMRIPQLPGEYRIFGTMLVRDPLGYFHQRWKSDESGSGLKKFWFEIGELANGAAEGNLGWRRIKKVREARQIREARERLTSRMELTPEERKAQEALEEHELAELEKHDQEALAEIDRQEQKEKDEARADTEQALSEEGKELKDPEEFSVKELSDYSSRLARISEFSQAEEPAGSVTRAITKEDQAAIEAFEESSKRGLVEQAKLRMLAHDVSHQEARELAYLFYRFKIDSRSRASFKKGIETALGYIRDSLAQQVSGRNYSLLSAMKKIAAFKYKQLLKGKGLAEELKYYIEDHPTISKEAATKRFYNEKQQRAYEYALEEIRDIHVATKLELDQLPRRAARIRESQTTPDYPLYPDRFAWRVTEAFGDTAARNLEALSVSPQRAAGRAVRELTDAGRLGEVNLPGWVISRDPKTAAAKAAWLKTGEGQSWLKSPEGQEFLRDAGAAIIASKRISDRLSATTGLLREMTGKTGKGPIPGGPMPEPVGERIPESRKLSKKDQRYVQRMAEKKYSAKPDEETGAPGLTMKEHAAGRRLREEQSKELGIPAPPKPQESMTQEELLELGPKVFAQGGENSNPYQVRERITRRQGQMSPQDASLMIWYDRQLQKDADKLANDPNFGKESPEYKEAEKDWLEWRDWEQTVPGHAASDMLRMRRGAQDLDTGSWSLMKQELHKATKGKATPKEKADLEAMVDEQHGLEEGILEDEEAIRNEVADLTSMAVPPEQGKVIQEGTNTIEDFLKNAEKNWHRDEGTPMAMKGGKVAPLTPEERDSLIAKGIREMIDLSKSDSLSEASWRKMMVKKYPNSAPFLTEVWDPAKKLRDRLVNVAIGADKNTAIARRVLTRQSPTPEESKSVIARAVKENPGMRNISTAEAIHSWNYIRQKYFDKMTQATKEGDFDTVLTLAAKDLGIPRERLYRALIAKKSIRTITTAMYEKMDKSNRLRAHIRNWIDQKEHPWLVNVMKAVPRVFFMDKIFGHGFVGMITHASNLAFQPWAWKAYFGPEGGWETMYRMVLSDTRLGKKLIGDASVGFHARMMKAIETHDLYRMAKRAGLEVDPYRYRGDYEVGNIYRWMREKTYGRGFDSLKKLRLDLFKTWWDTLTPEMQTDKMAGYIANDVNHMTGIVHTRFPEWANWAFFAPKLATAQWGVLVADPLKAMGYLSHWKTSSPEQRSWAISQVKHKAAMVGVYFAGLAVNQGLLSVSNSPQKINFDDPKKSDFLAFKVGGFNVGLAGPMIQIVRLFSDMIHIAVGSRSQLEKTQTRQARMGERLWEYGRRKMSPFASFAVDVTTGQDFTGRPLPWSSDVLPRSRRMRGTTSYDWPEYALQTLAPIPVEEAIKEVWAQMGMDKTTIARIWRALAVAVPMALTGARVWEDPYAEEEPEAVKGPASSY